MKTQTTTTIQIGIDPGTRTGIAIIIDGRYTHIATGSILDAMATIDTYRSDGRDIALHVENPNFRKYFGDTGREKLQGAGSIKRDYAIWVEYAARYNVRFFPVSPAAIGSQFDNVDIFRAATGYTGTTSQHARDAAKIIYKFYK